MASDVDALRTLGLAPGASQAEIKRAYRRLAKTFHPDTAGEAAIPRFLAIQAAYEALTGTSLGRARWPTAPRDVWQADPERARATRDGWRGRGFGRPGEPRTPGSAETESGDGGTTRRSGTRRPRRDRAPDKATPGSTTYDVADDEPFDPEWSGASWYGTSSGTYWTINPREYADPRKHGPEYQARGRRATAGGPNIDEHATGTHATETPPTETAGTETPPTESGSAEPAAPGLDAAATADRRQYTPPPQRPPRQQRMNDVMRGSSFGARLPIAGRLPLALIGWPPIGILLIGVIGEASGCSRFSAGCSQDTSVVIWLAQLVVVTILLAVPRLAAISSIGTLVALAAAVPATLLLSVGGGAQERAASIALLSVVLSVAYLAGVAYGVIGGSRRLRP